MPSCKCAGSSCGCSVLAGHGVGVSGTGTASDPFVVSIDPSTFSLGSAIRTASSSTVELSQIGTGAANDPVILTADMVLKSSDGKRWAPSISTTGVVTWALAGPQRSGTGPSDGSIITVVSNDILYWNGTSWDARSTQLAHAVWISLGYTGVPIPPGFKKGDSWFCEAS